MKVVGLRGLWLGVFLVACATSPASSPQPVPRSTTRSVPAALTVPIDPESESVVQKLAAKVGWVLSGKRSLSSHGRLWRLRPNGTTGWNSMLP